MDDFGSKAKLVAKAERSPVILDLVGPGILPDSPQLNLDIADPQVQPMALIRETDGPDESIQGLYVTETDDRIYLATVSTEGCDDDLVPHSGRLLWVPRSEVVAMSVGPPQSVEDAAKTALEMSYALTPAVETPAGSRATRCGCW